MDAWEKREKRTDFLEKFVGITSSGWLLSPRKADLRWESDYDDDSKLLFHSERERKFVEDLNNVIHAYNQSRGCPCSECILNFVTRAALFYQNYIKEGSE